MFYEFGDHKARGINNADDEMDNVITDYAQKEV